MGISGSTIVVGAPQHGGGQQGAAYVYGPQGTSWAQTQELAASDGAGGDNLGAQVAASGPTIVAASPFHAVAGNPDGAAYRVPGVLEDGLGDRGCE